MSVALTPPLMLTVCSPSALKRLNTLILSEKPKAVRCHATSILLSYSQRFRSLRFAQSTTENTIGLRVQTIALVSMSVPRRTSLNKCLFDEISLRSERFRVQRAFPYSDPSWIGARAENLTWHGVDLDHIHQPYPSSSSFYRWGNFTGGQNSEKLFALECLLRRLRWKRSVSDNVDSIKTLFSNEKEVPYMS